MKRMMLVWVMILCLVPVLSLAEQGLASKELFPAEDDNGKWGYVNREGIFVIPPAFDHAFGFRRNYAEVVVFPDDYTGDRNPYYSGYSGIIDQNGVFVLEPVYGIDAGYDQMFYGGRDTGIWCITSGKVDWDNQLEGWFDIPSGYFSGLVWDGVYPWISESNLIPVIDETFSSGYADRTTGELVIPCQYESVDPSCFYGGVASVSFVDELGNATGYFLIDETGEEISLPEGIYAVPYEGAYGGLVMVADHRDVYGVYEEGTLFGFVDVQGHLVIEPQFIAAHHFTEGRMAVVQFPEGDWGLINAGGYVMGRGLTEDPWENEYEDELDYDTDEDDEDDDDWDYFSETGSWPLRDAEIIPGEDGSNYLCVTMNDGSGTLPPFATIDEYHAGDESILMDYPVMRNQYESWDDANESEHFFLTIHLIDGEWRVTDATNGWDWTADAKDGVWRFEDWYADEDASWGWETTGENRLTEIDFADLERMVAMFNDARPERPGLHD